MEHNLILIAKAIAKAFDQEWINGIRSNIQETCEGLITVLENR